MERYEIRLSGSGGQGLGLAGLVLAESLALEQNLYAVMTQAYGPEARGGASKSEVVVSDTDIHYPKAICPDFLLAINPESFRKFGNDTRPGGIILVETSAYAPGWGLQTDNLLCVPMADVVQKVTGRQTSINAVALGVMAEILDFIDAEALERVMLRRFPRQYEALNRQAYLAGRTYVQEKGVESMHPGRLQSDFPADLCDDTGDHPSEE